jgi:small subunit ribosomal protein S8
MNILANLSNALNNGQNKYKNFVKYPVSKLTVDLIILLFQENMIRGFFFEKNNKKYFVIILLKYESNNKSCQKVSFMPKTLPFKKHKDHLKYQNGLGLYILSTSKGIMTNYRSSKLKLGGIILMKIS